MWSFSHFGDKPAITDEEGQCVSFRQLDLLSVKLSSILQPRSVTLVFSENRLGAIAGMISLVGSGAVPLLVDLNHAMQFSALLLEKWKPTYLLVPHEIKNIFPYKEIVNIFDYTLLETGLNYEVGIHPDLALLLPTSGSTGSAKIVRLSYKNLETNISSIIDYLGITCNDKVITSLPVHFAYGLSVMMTHLFAGGEVIVTRKSPVETTFWQLVNKQRITSLNGVPFSYSLFQRLKFFDKEFRTIHTLTQAGGALPGPLHEFFARKCSESGRRFFVMYGQTEATSRISYLHPDDALRKTGSIGKAVPGGRIELIADDGTLITTPGIQGNLVYYGANVCMGYATSVSDLMQPDVNKGILHTGDLATFDTEGFYTITGRKSRLVKFFGQRVSLDEIEKIIALAFPEIPCACIGTDDLITLIVQGENPDNEIKNYLADITQIRSSMIKVLSVPVIPRTNSGKTDYLALSLFCQ
jgi:acyl-coenzyme A synthetase/AMP-(fatty) acid ligase